MQESWNKLMIFIFLRALHSEFLKFSKAPLSSHLRIPTTSYVKNVPSESQNAARGEWLAFNKHQESKYALR